MQNEKLIVIFLNHNVVEFKSYQLTPKKLVNNFNFFN
jgi:hypothetical protein